jgi:hypothetical protein
MVNTSITYDEWPSWEVDPSTRTSTHPYTKYYPFKVTLSSTNTAEDLFAVARGDAAVNLVTNPRVEAADITQFIATGATRARSTAQQDTGAASLLVDPGNSASGEGIYTEVSTGGGNGQQPVVLTGQATVRGHSSSDAVQIIITDSSDVTKATGNTVSLSSSFQQLQVKYEIPALTASNAYRIKIITTTNHTTDFYIDKFHNEIRNGGGYSTYTDGSQGRNFSWFGTADASMSRKRVDSVVIRGIRLHTSHDIWLAFDCTASSSTGIWVGDPAAATPSSGFFETTFPIDFRKNVSFVNGTGSETPLVYGVVWGIHQA